MDVPSVRDYTLSELWVPQFPHHKIRIKWCLPLVFVSKYLNECELLYLEDHGRDLSNMRVWSHLGENQLPQTHLRSHFGKERNNQ